MVPTKLYFNTALKALENKNNFLVWWFPWNGMIRNNDGEEVGEISTQIMQKLIDSEKLIFIGRGSDLLDHEKYYKLKIKKMKITLKIEKEFDAKFLQVEAGVRYWEDASVNDVEDTEGDLIPCRDGDTWNPIIELETGKIVNWEIGKSADIHYKVCDDGKYILQDENRDHIKTVQDYVISDLAIGESGYGDYIIMKVSENGYIYDWMPTLEEFQDDEED